MKKIISIVLCIFALVSCNTNKNKLPKMQYQAEAEFNASLKQSDKDKLMQLTESFMSLVKSGDVEKGVSLIYVLDGNVVYQKSPEYTDLLVKRFSPFVSCDYDFVSVAYSTPGNNDVVYNVAIPGGISLRITFNPVFVNGDWYLTMKDGYQSSKDMAESDQIHPYAPAPAPVRLNKPSEK